MLELLPEKATSSLRVFFTYAAPDKTYANEMLHTLESQSRVRVFTTDTLSAGGDWQGTMRDELEKCDLFLALLTLHSQKSNWVLFELGGALALKKPILLVATQPEALENLPLDFSQMVVAKFQDFANPDLAKEILQPYRISSLPLSSDSDSSSNTIHPTP